MKRIRIAICDDDSIGRGLLQESLEYLLQENNLQADISSYCSGQELLREQNRYDILFLDIRMPKINGIRTAEKYREWYEDTIIIFLTSYEDYVFEGYKVNAFRYLDVYKRQICGSTDFRCRDLELCPKFFYQTFC